MQITVACTQCGETSSFPTAREAVRVTCGQCGQELLLAGLDATDGKLTRCLACPSTDLFLRKDFSQRLGVTIVVIGFAASCVAWYFHKVLLTYGILFATAGVDLLLYLIMGDLVECYRCHSQYRDVPKIEELAGFNLETHEKYRQQAARMKDEGEGED